MLRYRPPVSNISGGDMDGSSQLIALERQTCALQRRVETLETMLGVSALRPAEGTVPPRPEFPPGCRVTASGTPSSTQSPALPAISPRAAGARTSVEDLLGGRVLAWAGGIAIVVGVALVFVLAISQGWIDPL